MHHELPGCTQFQTTPGTVNVVGVQHPVKIEKQHSVIRLQPARYQEIRIKHGEEFSKLSLLRSSCPSLRVLSNPLDQLRTELVETDKAIYISLQRQQMRRGRPNTFECPTSQNLSYRFTTTFALAFVVPHVDTSLSFSRSLHQSAGQTSPSPQ